MRVHCFSGSPYTWRVLMVLHHKGIEHEALYIPRQSGDHRSEVMLSANPRGKLPILEADDLRLYESSAICRWLEARFVERPLLPDAPAARALCEVRIAEAAYVLPPFDDAGMYLFTTPADARDPAVYDAKLGALHAELARWEGYLARPDAHGRGGTSYLVGDQLTLADVMLFPLLGFVVRVGLPLAPRYPALAAYYARVAALDSAQASWPPHWRESEGADIGFADYERRHPPA